jgi:ketosteroid isomerase-like protein
MPERFASPPPDDPADQLRWLVDRALISDLLIDFARRVDSHDQAGYAANFTPDAVLDMPFGLFEGRDKIAAMRGPAPPMGTHHLSTNHMIELDGDLASSRTYLQATHIADVSDPHKFWQAGGWYDCEFARTSEGWKFTRVKLTVRWAGGDPHGAAPVSRDDSAKEG